MRHIWSFKPSNRGFCHPTQQFQVIKSSIACMYQDSSETSSYPHRSNIQRRGRSNAASASSGTLEERKARRRVSKDERKLMVENYVKKYAETNYGKFPGVTDTRKSVGGSHYVVRQILQELEYNSRLTHVDDKSSVSLEKSSAGKDGVFNDFLKASETKELKEFTRVGPKENSIMDGNSKSFKPKKVSRSTLSVQSDKSKVTGSKSSMRYDSEKHVKLETVHESNVKVDQIPNKPEIQESAEPEISGREFHKTPAGDPEPQRKYSLWQNLRSFANSILGTWKRS